MTLAEIVTEIKEAFMADADIQSEYGFDSGAAFDDVFSDSSIEEQLISNIAYTIHLHEAAQAAWLVDVENTALATRYGTKQWWYAQTLLFQLGDTTTVLENGSVGYSVINEELRIVKFAAVTESGRTINIKVAKGDVGAMEPLTAAEVVQLKSYLSDIKPLGTRCVASSSAADELKLSLNIYYDGEKTRDEIEADVKTAINEYFSSIQFAGTIYKNKLIEAIQAVDGITDVEIVSMSAKSANANVYTSTGRTYNPEAGYVNLKAENLTINLNIE